MGTTVTFFCTRCGVQLEIELEAAGRSVRCGRCATIVRTPAAAAPSLFRAMVAAAKPPPLPAPMPAPTAAFDGPADSGDGATALGPLFGMVRDQVSFIGGQALVLPPVIPPPLPPAFAYPLSYVPAWPQRHERALWLDQMARRLEDVTAGDEDDAGSMTNCSYCGSTIAPFLKKCPYCRHALWGI